MALSIGELVGYVDLDSGPAEDAADRIGGMFDKMGGTWGKVLGGIGATAGGLFAAGLAGAMSAEAGSDKLAASLGGTSKMSERLGKVAGDVYSNGFGAGMDDVNTAIGAVVTSIKGMRHASDKDVQDMTERAMTYADVMEIDVTRAAQVAGNMVHNGLAKDGKEAFDLLMRASQKVPTQLREDVLDAADEYGTFFNQLGIDGPQAMGMLAEGAEQGMYGIDKAGDAVKEFTIRSTDMSQSSKDAYKMIGLDAGKMANAILAGGNKAKGATDKIVSGLLNIKDPAKRANASIALFGTPLEDLSTKDIPTFLRSLKNGESSLGKFKGSVDKAGQTAYDNASGNLSVFGRTLKTKFVELIGGSVLPKVTALTGKLATGLGPAFDTAADAAKRVAKFLGDHKTTATALVAVIGGLIAVTAAHSAVMAVAAAGGMAQWLRGTRLISGATKVWAAVQWALNAAMLANPLVLIVAGIALLAAGLVLAWKKSETFRKIVKGALDKVRDAAKAVGDFFTKKVPAFFTKAWDKIKSGATAVGNFFTKSVPNFFRRAWETVKNLVTSGAAKVWSTIKALPGKIVGGLSNLKSKLGDVFSRAMEYAKEKVVSIGGKIREWIAGIPGKLGELAGKFGQAGRDLLQGFIDGMKNAAGIIAGIASNVWDAVKGLLNGAIDKINAALEFKISLPGPDLNVNLPNIPHLATGGRVTSDTIARIGEKEPETVLRDRDIVKLLTKARDAGRGDTTGNGGRNAPLIGTVVHRGLDENLLAEQLWFKTRTRG